MGPGYFGKLPGHGDFLARGLPPGWRTGLDAWLTRWLAPVAGDPDAWPPGGIRAALEVGGQGVLIVAGPSVDSAGRAYPVAACVALNGADRVGADRWCDPASVALARAVAGRMDADTLLAALKTVRPPERGDVPVPPQLVWSDAVAGPPDRAIPAILAVAETAPVSSGEPSSPS